MADQKKRLSELPSSTSTSGLYTLGVNADNEGVKIPIGQLLNEAKTKSTNAANIAREANNTATEAAQLAETADINSTNAKNIAEAIIANKAKPGGLATLGSDGKVLSNQLPTASAVDFSGFVEDVAILPTSDHNSTDAGFSVVFDRKENKFLLRYQVAASGEGIGTRPQLSQYWHDWNDRDRFILKAGRIYINKAENILYIYNGSTLISAGVATAALTALQENIDALYQSVADNKTHCDTFAESTTSTLSTLRTDVDTISQTSTQAKSTADTALNSANVATQSVSAALANANDAKNAVTNIVNRVVTLEGRVIYEELASEAEWQSRKEAGTLDTDKLYFVAEV